MQTVIQVIASGRESLRNKIMSDRQLEKKFGFIKVSHKQPGRPHGWEKYTALAMFMERLTSIGTRAAEL
jgi:hypothetical protein